MSLTAAVGQAQDPDGQQAGVRAAQAALSKLGRNAPALGFVVASHDYPIQSVLNGVSAQLGETPLLGFSSAPELPAYRPAKQAVAVGLLGGGEMRARAERWPGRRADTSPADNGNQPEGSEDSRQAVYRMLQAFPPEPESMLLFIADGLSSDAHTLVSTLGAAVERHRSPAGDSWPVAGCLAEANPRWQRSQQISDLQSGNAGLSAARLEGAVSMGVGVGHGWQPVGPYFQVTRAHGRWIEQLDGRPAVESYARLFGYPAQEWRQPPLNELVRLYPLGLEQAEVDMACAKDCPYLVRTPLLVEEDGSLRMVTAVPQGVTAHLLVGSAEACLESARQAAHQALEGLARVGSETRPVLALVWVDAAWQKLLEGQPEGACQAVRSVLGSHVPVLGGYTHGQIAGLNPNGPLELLNQHILVLVFGEPAAAR